ncbi:MAG: YadA-like family protein, partial [Erythrobacter sp.]
GWRSTAVAERAQAFGHLARALGVRSLAVGEEAEATAQFAIAVGDNADAVGEGSIAMGNLAVALGEDAIAIGGDNDGNGARAYGDGTTVLGGEAFAGQVADGEDLRGGGLRPTDLADGATAVGWRATVTADRGSAFGWQALATGQGATAFGARSEASGARAIALGEEATSSGEGSVAIGASASAGFDGAVAIGTGASAARTNQVVLGGSGSSVTVGDLAASTEAQDGEIFLVTTDGSGTLGQGVSTSSFGSVANVAANTAAISSIGTRVTTNETAIAALQGDLEDVAEFDDRITATEADIAALQTLGATNSTRIDTLFGQTEANRQAIDRANEGVAMALAMESPMLPAGTSFALSGGVGYFEDQGAGTVALSARVSDTASVSAGVGVGFDSGEVGARGGFQVAW